MQHIVMCSRQVLNRCLPLGLRRLAAQALGPYARALQEGSSLLAVRDMLIARVGLEDNGAAGGLLSCRPCSRAPPSL